MQYIPQNANDLAKEYMNRSLAQADHDRVLAPIVEGKIRRGVRSLVMSLLHLVKRDKPEPPEQDSSVDNRPPEWEHSHALS